MKLKAMAMFSLFMIPVVFVLGYHLGRFENFTTLTLNSLSQLGSFLAGATGVILTFLAVYGFNSWKNSFRANVIADRISKAEEALESTVVKFFTQLGIEVGLERFSKLYGDNLEDLDSHKLNRRKELVESSHDAYALYKQALAKYKLEVLGLSVVVDDSLERISSERLAEVLSEIESRAIELMRSSPKTLSYSEEQTSVFQEFKTELFKQYPFK
ncbi:hypothetical protein C7Y69_15680 [Alteromonas sp. KS69]|uniref:hypothetical protein n=1 Tax=Alteromonas sp. KS69 TaxID=2109917 RepID=UPI000F867616|nr:hypothetical protein [Alteromonas sp. KS69]RUP77250.1 hypothetical protein C7Y69_15680 [Alteromonas sp. KS69]|tara:strand:- start:20708 stop:21349 length:642 start_codon:yes stop_codon:yes gene_type:complete